MKPTPLHCHTTALFRSAQGKQILEGGIGRASEVEEAVDAVPARKYLDSPSAMLQESPLLKGLNE